MCQIAVEWPFDHLLPSQMRKVASLSAQPLIKETRHHAHLADIGGCGLARLSIGFVFPQGDDDALARIGSRQHLKALETPLLLQNRRQTLSNPAHLRLHIRRKPDVGHPCVHMVRFLPSSRRTTRLVGTLAYIPDSMVTHQ